MEEFVTAQLRHVSGKPKSGNAAFRVISEMDFSQARAEITQWEKLFANTAYRAQISCRRTWHCAY